MTELFTVKQVSKMFDVSKRLLRVSRWRKWRNKQWVDCNMCGHIIKHRDSWCFMMGIHRCFCSSYCYYRFSDGGYGHD